MTGARLARAMCPGPKPTRHCVAAKYDGWMTIEAFGRAIPALAAATRVWRDFFPTRDSVYLEGLKQMKQGWARAK